MIIKDSEHVDLGTASGPMRTYLFRPVAGGRYPGIVLFSEIFQVTGPIRRTAAMLAGHGFVVAVPEIFHELEAPGCAIPYDEKGAATGNAHKVAKELASYDADARAAIACLEGHAACTGAIGVMGICIGGHLAFRAAMNPQVRAAVCFYATDIHKRSLGKGTSDDSLARAGEIEGELCMIWGRQDPHVPQEGRLAIYQRLAEVGARFTWHEWNGAHAFLRDEGYRYDAELAHLCTSIALATFRRRLSEGDLPAEATGSAETKH